MWGFQSFCSWLLAACLFVGSWKNIAWSCFKVARIIQDFWRYWLWNWRLSDVRFRLFCLRLPLVIMIIITIIAIVIALMMMPVWGSCDLLESLNSESVQKDTHWYYKCLCLTVLESCMTAVHHTHPFPMPSLTTHPVPYSPILVIWVPAYRWTVSLAGKLKHANMIMTRLS